jgi:hypothetical protein
MSSSNIEQDGACLLPSPIPKKSTNQFQFTDEIDFRYIIKSFPNLHEDQQFSIMFYMVASIVTPNNLQELKDKTKAYLLSNVPEVPDDLKKLQKTHYTNATPDQVKKFYKYHKSNDNSNANKKSQFIILCFTLMDLFYKSEE